MISKIITSKLFLRFYLKIHNSIHNLTNIFLVIFIVIPLNRINYTFSGSVIRYRQKNNL